MLFVGLAPLPSEAFDQVIRRYAWAFTDLQLNKEHLKLKYYTILFHIVDFLLVSLSDD